MNEIKLQKGIIEYKHPDVSKRKNLTDREKRAACSTPNTRLISAFGVNNVFTTRDTDRDANWRPLIEDIKQTAEAEFAGTQTSINLTKVIQYVTLKVSLKYLFGLDEDD
ncbi:MAG: hypothetical protein M1823_007062, partial [Watsoniomyces obsoletus]